MYHKLIDRFRNLEYSLNRLSVALTQAKEEIRKDGVLSGTRLQIVALETRDELNRLLNKINDNVTSDQYNSNYLLEKKVSDLVDRLLKRAEIRRSIPRGEPDRISDILEEAANKIILLEEIIRGLEREIMELTHECNDLSSSIIMARAGNDYSNYGRGGDNL